MNYQNGIIKKKKKKNKPFILFPFFKKRVYTSTLHYTSPCSCYRSLVFWFLNNNNLNLRKKEIKEKTIIIIIIINKNKDKICRGAMRKQLCFCVMMMNTGGAASGNPPRGRWSHSGRRGCAAGKTPRFSWWRFPIRWSRQHKFASLCTPHYRIPDHPCKIYKLIIDLWTKI